MRAKENTLSYLFLSFFLAIFNSFGQNHISGTLEALSILTIEESPIIRSNRLQIDRSMANFRAQQSSFDYQLSSGVNVRKDRLTLFDADPRKQLLSSRLETNNTGISLGLQKKFRTGLIANISTDYSKRSDNLPLNRFNENVEANIPEHATSATLSLTQPLLRGNGLKVTTAFEKAAALDIKSANENFKLNSAFEVLQMGNAYWQYLAAFKNLEVFKENEDRVRHVLEITEELVKADKKPASDLFQIKADLAEQERQTTVAKQNLYNARLNLGRVIGIKEAESKSINDPIDDFPTILASQFSEDNDISDFLELARNHRTDIKALANTKEGLVLQVHASKNGVLPRLDITGSLTYGGAATNGGLEQVFNALGNRQGRNNTIVLGLTFSFPVNNNRAKADLALSKIALSNQNIAYDNLIRNIDINVSQAYNNLNNSVQVLEKATQTLAYYQQVFDNEQTKFQNGLTTLLNLILFQERLTFAHLEYLRAQQEFALAILNLRFETGTLIKTDQNTIPKKIDRSIFYTIPK
ncbi:TolC family protein [Sungkyunkwania multivorans]|uniref:TolC family protein n=1 Tax=Sungkyunkwania multivorans TaxID=1173618 RepID=A0ABW3CZ04_9FLAO